MANEEHLKILKQGVEVWNKWRRYHPTIQPDFRGAQLHGEDLGGADLRDADLRGTDLSEANISAANLTLSDIRRAYLVGVRAAGTNLSGANLTLTDLSNADLRRANFSGARVVGVTLKSTFLLEAVFNEAVIGVSIFADLDLRTVKGLKTVSHVNPSDISISTIYLSEGKIPEVFLRGCGIPEAFIVQIPALVAAVQPIQFYSCFISYSSKDQKFAERLYADLQNKGVRCWYAPEALKIGEKIRVGIDESIRIHDKLLLILSKNSIGSEWVEKEVETAIERERKQKRVILFPIRLDDSVLNVESGWAADVRRSRNIGDFCRWKSHDTYSKAFDRLLRDLKAEA